MRKLVLAAAALAGLSGCGGKTTLNTAPLSDEEKRQIAEHDRKVEDEESGGRRDKSAKKK